MRSRAAAPTSDPEFKAPLQHSLLRILSTDTRASTQHLTCAIHQQTTSQLQPALAQPWPLLAPLRARLRIAQELLDGMLRLLRVVEEGVIRLPEPILPRVQATSDKREAAMSAADLG